VSVPILSSRSRQRERDRERACLGPLCRGLEAWAMTTQSIAHYYRSHQVPRRRPTRELRAPQRPRGQPASCREKVHGARWTWLRTWRGIARRWSRPSSARGQPCPDRRRLTVAIAHGHGHGHGHCLQRYQGDKRVAVHSRLVTCCARSTRCLAQTAAMARHATVLSTSPRPVPDC
jgi:hypothetical protein